MDRPREPLPTRVEATPSLPPEYATRSTPGLDALGADAHRRRPALPSTVTSACCWPGPTAINLTAIREPAAVAIAHVVDSLSGVAVLRERGVDRFIDLGLRRRLPGPAARGGPARGAALLLEPVAKKAAFLSAVAAATGLAGDGRGGAGPRRGAGRRCRASRPLAGGHRPRRRPASAELVELAFPLLAPGGVPRRLEARRPRAELAAAERAIDALGGGIDRGPAGRGRPGSTAIAWSSSRARGRVPGRLPARPGVAQAPAMVSDTLLDWTACASPCSPTSMQPARPRCRPRQCRCRSTPSGTSATSSATAPSPTASSTA